MDVDNTNSDNLNHFYQVSLLFYAKITAPIDGCADEVQESYLYDAATETFIGRPVPDRKDHLFIPIVCLADRFVGLLLGEQDDERIESSCPEPSQNEVRKLSKGAYCFLIL